MKSVLILISAACLAGCFEGNTSVPDSKRRESIPEIHVISGKIPVGDIRSTRARVEKSGDTWNLDYDFGDCDTGVITARDHQLKVGTIAGTSSCTEVGKTRIFGVKDSARGTWNLQRSNPSIGTLKRNRKVAVADGKLAISHCGQWAIMILPNDPKELDVAVFSDLQSVDCKAPIDTQLDFALKDH